MPAKALLPSGFFSRRARAASSTSLNGFAVDIDTPEPTRYNTPGGGVGEMAQELGKRLRIVGGLRPGQSLGDVGDALLLELAVLEPELLGDDGRTLRPAPASPRSPGGIAATFRIGVLDGLATMADHARCSLPSSRNALPLSPAALFVWV